MRRIRDGHPWVYRDALRDAPQAHPGTLAALYSPGSRRPVANGFYDPKSALAFRVCDPSGARELNNAWASERLEAASLLRMRTIPPGTTGYRLVNGEGDGLPGLVIDRYGDTAVIKLDGPGPEGFWGAHGIAEFLTDRLRLAGVVRRPRDREQKPDVLTGDPPQESEFLEHGLRFTADVIQGQKTGFFLDQRENRRLMRDCCGDQTVLNLFSYTGGFSIAAGAGGAREVTSVDSAAPAIAVADRHWRLNGLPEGQHTGVVADAFAFLAEAQDAQRRWEVVIVDPPSFAPSSKSVPRAQKAYTRLIAASASVVAPDGLLAACSCSSHIDEGRFLEICGAATTEARRRARILTVAGQPADHPWPIACPELRYLKFVLMQLD
ncbi:MAG: class I SAM-dependent rRNA methyltransferase [Planctomyces sp.]|nr:class I SAM-dependent rRNA methyltransferase [Planctomyces sp.]